MPAVSVIIPVYKVEPYMARCARSLFSQTMEDLEFIFIDDCSPDRSIDVMREVLEEFPERKDQVVVYRMPRNSGQAAVRMQGLALARGEYVIHCDTVTVTIMSMLTPMRPSTGKPKRRTWMSSRATWRPCNRMGA